MSARVPMLVVGASVASGALVAQLRADGHTGRIVVVDRDPDAPYDRPPLSKDFLTSADDRPAAPWWRADCELLTGDVYDLDAVNRTATVRSPDGSRLELAADELVVATGSAPLRVPGQPHGVIELRTAADARALRTYATPGYDIVVLGAGTVGTELASSLTAAGAAVTLIDVAEQPLQRFLGGHLGAEAAAWIRAGGVDLRLGERVTAIREAGRGRWLVQTDRSMCAADVVVSAIGTRPVTGWLAGAGLRVDNGVVCDIDGQALSTDGTPVSGVHAIGDVASWAGQDGSRRRREDWTSAQRQGRHVARRLLGLEPLVAIDAEREYFWSNQFGRRIQVLGTPASTGTLVRQVADPDRNAAFYTVEGEDRTLAWISINRPREFALAMRQSVLAAR